MEELTNKEREQLIDCKTPYRDTRSISFTFVILVYLLIVAVYLLKAFNESFLFTSLQIQWTFPLVSSAIICLIYFIGVKKINSDLKLNKKKCIDATVYEKGITKYGTYSTGDYKASGSSNQYFLQLGGYKYNCSKEEFNKYLEGDKVTISIAINSKIVLNIK